MATSLRDDNEEKLHKQLTSDICYLFHELAAYRHIMGDLNYAKDYALPYWDLINHVDTGSDSGRLIRSGILILMMAMLHDAIDSSGGWITQHLAAISAALNQFVPEDDEMLRLSDSVMHGVELLRNNSQQDDRFDDDSAWAYNAFVRRYFENGAKRRPHLPLSQS